MGNVKALEVKHILEKIIDKDYDSLRFYYLGNQYENKVEHIGVKPSFKLDDVLIL
ncbi:MULTISPECIES: CRISPR-associated endonuclease Cas2 [Erysipelotrichaceae]|jgi:CRISPR-associated protein Cas2|uniref:CRISPR-associated endonuclease Cas2 n=1 Tax=Amedibacillus hominis TaxID=2897776 RepID=A0ABS9R6Y4_9FIRM|nr:MULTISPECIES: CRISPR-associated endonuclease Cas2 [Erysipelotrichaceae]MCH4284549.1 CRISPR-associated endonuclease Cas2 [Amedibacillus hominis]